MVIKLLKNTFLTRLHHVMSEVSNKSHAVNNAVSQSRTKISFFFHTNTHFYENNYHVPKTENIRIRWSFYSPLIRYIACAFKVVIPEELYNGF